MNSKPEKKIFTSTLIELQEPSVLVHLKREGLNSKGCYKLNPLPLATRPLNSLRVFCILELYLKIQFELAVVMNRRIQI